MRDAAMARTWNERLPQRLERGRLRGGQRPQRNTLRPCRRRREQNFDPAYREGECAACRAFHEGASFHLAHAVLPISASVAPRRSCRPACSELFKVIVTLLCALVN